MLTQRLESSIVINIATDTFRQCKETKVQHHDIKKKKNLHKNAGSLC